MHGTIHLTLRRPTLITPYVWRPAGKAGQGKHSRRKGILFFAPMASSRGIEGPKYPISPALQVRDISFGDYFAWSPQLQISVMPLKTKALTGGKPLTIVCPWQNAMIHPKFLSPLNPDTDSPREDAKRLKTIDWVYWKISSTPFLVDGVSWSSLAGGALRSAQAVALWPSGLQSGWDPAAKWWRRT